MATLLLAKRLTNQIIRAAEQAGITLECDLQNYRNDGEREAAYCKGNVYNPKTGNSVSVLTSRLAPETVRVAFL